MQKDIADIKRLMEEAMEILRRLRDDADSFKREAQQRGWRV